MNRADHRWPGDVAADLRRILAAVDSPPASVRDAARAAFLTREMDGEFAALIADSWSGAGAYESVRTASPAQGKWQLSFCGGGVEIDLEIDRGRGGLRLLGQMTGASGDCRLETEQNMRTLDLDQLGRFVVDGLRPGPIRLRCRLIDGRQITTAWVAI